MILISKIIKNKYNNNQINKIILNYLNYKKLPINIFIDQTENSICFSLLEDEGNIFCKINNDYIEFIINDNNKANGEA